MLVFAAPTGPRARRYVIGARGAALVAFYRRRTQFTLTVPSRPRLPRGAQGTAMMAPLRRPSGSPSSMGVIIGLDRPREPLCAATERRKRPRGTGPARGSPTDPHRLKLRRRQSRSSPRGSIELPCDGAATRTTSKHGRARAARRPHRNKIRSHHK